MNDEPYVRVAQLTQLPPGSSQVVNIAGTEVAVFNVGGELFAIENTCPHQGGPLADGWVDAEEMTVTCPWHAWCFDLRTGKMTLGDFAQQRVYDVHSDGRSIFLRPAGRGPMFPRREQGHDAE